MSGQRTYWHLSNLGRKPDDYDIATTRLLYYPARGFEVRTPIAQWYERYQQGCPLQLDDWDSFRDPRATTYTAYTQLQKEKDAFVGQLLRATDLPRHDQNLAAIWVEQLEDILAPLRYPVHALQMVAAYLGSMAPGGRLVVTFMLQSADEIRRVQWLAQRMRQLQHSYPDFGAGSKTVWQEAPHWQPLRRLIEQLLITYDWGEAFVALNLVLKPAFDDLFGVQLARHAAASNDTVLEKLLGSLQEDCRWHALWSQELLRVLNAHGAHNNDFIKAAMERWQGRLSGVLEPLAERMATPLLYASDHADQH